MIKIFFIYALIAGIFMTYFAFVNLRGELEEGIEAIKKEYEATDKQIYTVFFILLFSLGWAWVPYKIVRTLIKLIRGDE